MFLEQIVRKQETLINMRKRAAATVVAGPSSKREGKTIGLKIADGMRERLIEQSKRVGAKSYSQFVMMCVELGLETVEQSKP